MKKIEWIVLPIALSFSFFFFKQSGNPELFFKLAFVITGIYNNFIGLYYLLKFFTSNRNIEFLNVGMIRMLLGVGILAVPALMSWR